MLLDQVLQVSVIIDTCLFVLADLYCSAVYHLTLLLNLIPPSAPNDFNQERPYGRELRLASQGLFEPGGDVTFFQRSANGTRTTHSSAIAGRGEAEFKE